MWRGLTQACASRQFLTATPTTVAVSFLPGGQFAGRTLLAVRAVARPVVGCGSRRAGRAAAGIFELLPVGTPVPFLEAAATQAPAV